MLECEIDTYQTTTTTTPTTVTTTIITLFHYVLLCTFQAYNCIEEMRNRLRTVNLSYYVDPKIIAAVHQALDIPMKETRQPNGFRMAGDDEEEDGEEVDEDVIDD